MHFLKNVSMYKTIGDETFTEYDNGEKVPGSFFHVIDENGKTCLRTFFSKGAVYKDRECHRLGEYDQFRIGDGGGTVRVDVVGRMPDRTLILTDRKTGRDDAGNETELRMAACVLWAKEFSAMDLNEVGTELVFLKT